MVPGLDRFQDHFKEYRDKYILIGGAACDTLLEDAGLDFRATKDLDIVLRVEALDVAFIEAFWAFIKKGGYKHQHKKTGEPCFYRFTEPDDSSYPIILELFSRKIDALSYEGEPHLTPIPVEDELSSLSAILLNEEYYDFLHEHKQEMDGITIVGPEALIPLKAKAWMDNSDRRKQGHEVRSSDIKKHRGDIPRIFTLLTAETKVSLPQGIENDMNEFLTRMIDEEDEVDLVRLGVTDMAFSEFLDRLKEIYIN